MAVYRGALGGTGKAPYAVNSIAQHNIYIVVSYGRTSNTRLSLYIAIARGRSQRVGAEPGVSLRSV